MSIVYRNNRLFSIDKEYIKVEHRTSSVINGLYTAIYDEFRGAYENDKYKKLTFAERMSKLNLFAEKWLKDRGFYK